MLCLGALKISEFEYFGIMGVFILDGTDTRNCIGESGSLSTSLMLPVSERSETPQWGPHIGNLDHLK